jgi:flagellar biosynthetic protein FliQ
MNESIVLEMGRNALQMTLVLTLPIVAVSLIVGIVIGIFQAATQIHEPTISFVPKILAIFLVLALLGPWMLQNLTQYAQTLFTSLPALAH